MSAFSQIDEYLKKTTPLPPPVTPKSEEQPTALSAIDEYLKTGGVPAPGPSAMDKIDKYLGKVEPPKVTTKQVKKPPEKEEKETVKVAPLPPGIDKEKRLAEVRAKRPELPQPSEEDLKSKGVAGEFFSQMMGKEIEPTAELYKKGFKSASGGVATGVSNTAKNVAFLGTKALETLASLAPDPSVVMGKSIKEKTGKDPKFFEKLYKDIVNITGVEDLDKLGKRLKDAGLPEGVWKQVVEGGSEMAAQLPGFIATGGLGAANLPVHFATGKAREVAEAGGDEIEQLKAAGEGAVEGLLTHGIFGGLGKIPQRSARVLTGAGTGAAISAGGDVLAGRPIDPETAASQAVLFGGMAVPGGTRPISRKPKGPAKAELEARDIARELKAETEMRLEPGEKTEIDFERVIPEFVEKTGEFKIASDRVTPEVEKKVLDIAREKGYDAVIDTEGAPGWRIFKREAPKAERIKPSDRMIDEILGQGEQVPLTERPPKPLAEEPFPIDPLRDQFYRQGIEAQTPAFETGLPPGEPIRGITPTERPPVTTPGTIPMEARPPVEPLRTEAMKVEPPVEPLDLKVSKFRTGSLEKPGVLTPEQKFLNPVDRFMYEPSNVPKAYEEAEAIVRKNVDRGVKSLTEKEALSGANEGVMIEATMNELARQGRDADQAKFLQTVTPKVTGAAQFLQSLSHIGDPFSPTGILKSAQRMVNETRADRRTEKGKRAFDKQLEKKLKKDNEIEARKAVRKRLSEMERFDPEAIALEAEGIQKGLERKAKPTEPRAKRRAFFDEEVRKEIARREVAGEDQFLSPEFIGKTRRWAEGIQKMPMRNPKEIRRVDIAKGELLKFVANRLPISKSQKVETFQTAMQLLNVKTQARNVFGNTGYAVLDTLQQYTTGLAIDAALSLKTGKRTISAPRPSDIAKNVKTFFSELKKGSEDAVRGIDTLGPELERRLGPGGKELLKKMTGDEAGRVLSQYDVRSNTFKGPFFGVLEKALGVTLKAPDRAFFKTAMEDYIRNTTRARKLDAPTPRIVAEGVALGLQRTFQQNSNLARFFTKVKRGLNDPFGRGWKWGLGSLIMKYPKTPANLLQNALDFGPGGFVKGSYQLWDLMRKGDASKYAQSDVAMNLSRGVYGTGLFLAALHAANVGLLTGSDPDKPKELAFNRATGIRKYSFNQDGWTRWFNSGFDPKSAELRDGDELGSYDWAQPMSISVAMAVEASKKIRAAKTEREKSLADTHAALMLGETVSKDSENIIDTSIATVRGGLEALGEQPLVSGAKRFFETKRGGTFVVDNLLNALKGAPTSFIPTLLGQFRYSSDPKFRDIQSEDDSLVEETWNLIKNKLPGLSKTLPSRVGVLGEESKINQTSKVMDIVNTFATPWITSRVQMEPGVKFMHDLYGNTGSTDILPKDYKKFKGVTKKSVTIPFDITVRQEFQKFAGKFVRTFTNDLVKNKAFINADPVVQAKLLKKAINKIGNKTKKVFLSTALQVADLNFRLAALPPEKHAAAINATLKGIKDKELKGIVIKMLESPEFMAGINQVFGTLMRAKR
jgi:hypothetical protein